MVILFEEFIIPTSSHLLSPRRGFMGFMVDDNDDDRRSIDDVDGDDQSAYPRPGQRWHKQCAPLLHHERKFPSNFNSLREWRWCGEKTPITRIPNFDGLRQPLSGLVLPIRPPLMVELVDFGVLFQLLTLLLLKKL